jgi:hypothetical protein
MEGAFSRNACETLSLALSSSMTSEEPREAFPEKSEISQVQGCWLPYFRGSGVRGGYLHHVPLLAFLDRNLPGGSSAWISATILEAINRFSRLNLAVRYTRFRRSTRVRNLSFPVEEVAKGV